VGADAALDGSGLDLLAALERAPLAADGERHLAEGLQLRTRQGDLERGCAGRIAASPIGRGERAEIHGAAGGNSRRGKPVAGPALDGGERSWRYYAQQRVAGGAPAFRRWTRLGQLADGLEHDAIAGTQERRRGGGGIEHARRDAPEQAPSARRFGGIDPGVAV